MEETWKANIFLGKHNGKSDLQDKNADGRIALNWILNR
jgi:hypothetical protein